VRKSLKEFVVEYGAIGLIVYLSSTVIVCLIAWFALSMGWKPESTVGSAGMWAAVYIIAKLTQPFRIAGSIAITPLIARVYERVTGRVNAS